MSSVATQKYVRKSFPVDAVQVTPENMKEIAKWCGGQVRHDGEKEGHLSRDYIKVRVAYPINERQTQAFLGDWVLKSGKSFKVYTNSAFEKSFEEKQRHEPARKEHIEKFSLGNQNFEVKVADDE